MDILLLDKTGTITFGNRRAAVFVPMPDVEQHELADAAQLSSLADETPEGRSHRGAGRGPLRPGGGRRPRRASSSRSPPRPA